MSKYTADDVQRVALCDVDDGWTFEKASDMLNEFARRLRQEEEENRRDPVTDPWPGDRIVYPNRLVVYFDGHTPHETNATVVDFESWAKFCSKPGATIIRRREVQ